ncbi:4-amino-4-deoxy-L-arabinose transferase-like glycosyltransferase [Sphingomonas sp. UYAg733]
MGISARIVIRRQIASGRSHGWPIDRTVVVAALILIVSAALLFMDRATMPIQLWDESRNIVNALEMREHGFALITTYGGAPDLWNTKPPLLIWLMTASVGVFGPTEWALRLPSMIAALGTILLLFWFVRRTTRSMAIAALAAALMVLSPAYFGEHSARTADYDALLLFFVTAYLCLLFLALHRQRPSGALLALIGAAICCAFLTKSIAALVPGVGVILYLLVTARWRRLWATTGYLSLALCIAVVLGVFLLLCEMQSPGYLRAAWFNDVSGRFGSSLVVEKSRWFYITQLRAGFFSATPLLFLSPIALFFARGRVRLVLLFSLCVMIGVLAAFTCAASKLNHYILPAIPFMATAAAITIYVMLGRVGAVWRSGARFSRLIAMVLLVAAAWPVQMGVAGAVARRYYVPIVGEGARSGQYGALFAKLAARADRKILVIDPGFMLEGKAHYAPVLLAYRQLWAARGMVIDHSTDLTMIDRAHGVVLASCDADGVARLSTRGRDIAGVDGCVAVLADQGAPAA